MSRKAQGLSLNTIIIAAVVLIVLIILVGMTTGYFKKWTPSFTKVSDTCQGNDGKVIEKDVACPAGFKESSTTYADVMEDKKCCTATGCAGFGGRCWKKSYTCPGGIEPSPCCAPETDRGKRGCASDETCCKL